MEKPLKVLLVDGSPVNLPGPSVELPLILITGKELSTEVIDPLCHSHEMDKVFASILSTILNHHIF